LAVLVCLGALLGGGGLLFGLANSRWVVISLPAPLFEETASRPAFEARLWAVMLVCFFMGVLAALAGLVHYRRRAREMAQRAAAAQAELAEVRRLLASLHGKG
jgi:hypothetical protein